jgi:hypothetical protein
MVDSKKDISTDDLKQAASDSVKAGEDIIERVRDLTLQALQTKHFDYAGMKEVINAMTAGISLGAEARTGDAKRAVADALSGLDQALMKSAEASRLALQELAARSRELNDGELKKALDQMKKLESDFIEAVSKASQTAGSMAKSEFRDFVTHAQRAGTDTGAVVAQTMREFSHRVVTQMVDAQAAGLDAARELNARFVQAASGFLQGLAESLRESSRKK